MSIAFNRIHERTLADVFNAGEWYEVVSAAEAHSMPVEQFIRMLVMYGVEKRAEL